MVTAAVLAALAVVAWAARRTWWRWLLAASALSLATAVGAASKMEYDWKTCKDSIDPIEEIANPLDLPDCGPRLF